MRTFPEPPGLGITRSRIGNGRKLPFFRAVRKSAGILIVNAGHLRRVLATHEAHFNEHRPHGSLGQAAPLRALPDPVEDDIRVIRRDLLGRLIHEYPQVA